jgi:hypothetical protein
VAGSTKTEEWCLFIGVMVDIMDDNVMINNVMMDNVMMDNG